MKNQYDLQGKYQTGKLTFAQMFSEQSIIRLQQCYYWEQDKDRIIYKRTMNCSFLYVVVEGDFLISSSGITEEIVPGQVIYMPAGQEHYAANPKRNIVKAYGIHFHWQLPGHRTDTRLFDRHILTIRFPEFWNEQLSRLTAVSNLDTEASAAPLCDDILRSLLIELIFSHPTVSLEHTDERINRAVEMILHDPNRWRDVKILARQVGLSPSRFRALFRHEIKVSPKAFIEKCRLDNCASEMLTSHLSIKEIAAKYEFSSPQYFNQAFKRHMGSAPREYRITHG